MTMNLQPAKYNFAEPKKEVCLRCGGRRDPVYGRMQHAPSCPELATSKIANTSGLSPKGVCVLVLPYEPEINTSVIIIPVNVRERTSMVEARAVVIALGTDLLGPNPKEEPRAQPGERVMLVRYAGVMAIGTADGRQYRLVNNRDIYCGIDEEKVNTSIVNAPEDLTNG